MKRVVVIASGATERRAPPILFGPLGGEGIDAGEVRIPPRHGDLTVEVVEKLIRTVWYQRSDARPAKVVVLVDTDRKTPEDALADLRGRLPDRLTEEMARSVQSAYAQQHLESWFFADAEGLRTCLGGALHKVDASLPDEIENPKRHLKRLLRSRLYTSRVSGEIARELDRKVVEERSRSSGARARARRVATTPRGCRPGREGRWRRRNRDRCGSASARTSAGSAGGVPGRVGRRRAARNGSVRPSVATGRPPARYGGPGFLRDGPSPAGGDGE